MAEHAWWITPRVGDEPLLPEPSRPCAGWIERTRKAEAEVELLTEQLRGGVDALTLIVQGERWPEGANAQTIALAALEAMGIDPSTYRGQ